MINVVFAFARCSLPRPVAVCAVSDSDFPGVLSVGFEAKEAHNTVYNLLMCQLMPPQG